MNGFSQHKWKFDVFLNEREEQFKEAIIEKLPPYVGKKILMSANRGKRRPPIRTGELRRSGSVFANGKLVGTTERELGGSFSYKGKGMPIKRTVVGKKGRVSLIYYAIDKGFNYAHYQNYKLDIGKPKYHLWAEYMMNRRNIKKYIKTGMRKILREYR